MSDNPIDNDDRTSSGKTMEVQIGWATLFLITTNALIYLKMSSVDSGGPFAHFSMPFLYDAGAVSAMPIYAGQNFRLVSAMFMHASFWHIMFNMWALFQLGFVVESLLGPALLFLVYLLSGILGFAWSVHFQSPLSVGASGAILGMAGAILSAALLAKANSPLRTIALQLRFPLLLIFGLGFGLELLAKFIPGVGSIRLDNAAHMGGLLSGAFVFPFALTLRKYWDLRQPRIDSLMRSIASDIKRASTLRSSAFMKGIGWLSLGTLWTFFSLFFGLSFGQNIRTDAQILEHIEETKDPQRQANLAKELEGECRPVVITRTRIANHSGSDAKFGDTKNMNALQSFLLSESSNNLSLPVENLVSSCRVRPMRLSEYAHQHEYAATCKAFLGLRRVWQRPDAISPLSEANTLNQLNNCLYNLLTIDETQSFQESQNAQLLTQLAKSLREHEDVNTLIARFTASLMKNNAAQVLHSLAAYDTYTGDYEQAIDIMNAVFKHDLGWSEFFNQELMRMKRLQLMNEGQHGLSPSES